MVCGCSAISEAETKPIRRLQFPSNPQLALGHRLEHGIIDTCCHCKMPRGLGISLVS